MMLALYNLATIVVLIKVKQMIETSLECQVNIIRVDVGASTSVTEKIDDDS